MSYYTKAEAMTEPTVPEPEEEAKATLDQLSILTSRFIRERDGLLKDLDHWTRLAGQVPDLPATFCEDCGDPILGSRGHYAVLRVVSFTGIETPIVRLCERCTEAAYRGVVDAANLAERRTHG